MIGRKVVINKCVSIKLSPHCIRWDNPRIKLSIAEQNPTPEQLWGWDFNPRNFYSSTPLVKRPCVKNCQQPDSFNLQTSNSAMLQAHIISTKLDIILLAHGCGHHNFLQTFQKFLVKTLMYYVTTSEYTCNSILWLWQPLYETLDSGRSDRKTPQWFGSSRWIQ